MADTATTIDLKPFCWNYRDGSPFNIDKPFVIGGFKYATDGAILIRIPTDEAPTEGRYPLVCEVFANKPAGRRSRLHKYPECDTCIGDGLTPARCSACDGRGQWSDDDFCDECRGSGALMVACKCRKCGHRVGAALVSLFYVRLIGTLPNPRVYPTATKDDPLRFVFDGGDGAVMGLKQE